MTNFYILCIICVWFYFIQKYKMDLPEQYKNLNEEWRREIVLNLIDRCWYEKNPKIVNSLTDEQINFLFNYVFIASKEERAKMLDTIQKKYESEIKSLKAIAKKLQKLDFQFAELLAQREDAQNFWKSIR